MLEGLSLIEVIERRRSCRSFSSQPIEPARLVRLDEILAQAPSIAPMAGAPAPDGHGSLRFVRIQASSRPGNASARKGAGGEAGTAAEAVRVGTYGTITGATQYVIGIMPANDKRMERFGYAFEWIVLSATALGLGTCWLGGFFDREGLSARLPMHADEFIPIISPVGYAGDKPTLADRMLRRSAGSDRRRAWGELFFDRSGDVPLTPGQAGAYRQPLEMVRLGPSASNKQPWRIVRQGDRFDFHLQRTRNYGLPTYDIQRNDIGIAQCHFELTAREIGLAGHWADETARAAESRRKLPGDFEYIVTWVMEGQAPDPR